VLVIKDAVLWAWGPKSFSARARPGWRGRSKSGPAFPTYDLFLIAVGPLVLGLLWLLLHRTRWGTLVRAATQDREMVGALGVNQAWLFTGVFALGALLAGPGRRAAAAARARPARPGPEHHRRRLRGGGGGRHGLASRRLCGRAADRRAQGLCIGLGLVEVFGMSLSFSKLTLVVEFLVMAVVLVWRPWGCWASRSPRCTRPASRGAAASRRAVALQWRLGRSWPAAGAGAAVGGGQWPYAPVLLIDMLWRCCLPPACTSSWGRRACTRSATPPTSGWAPMGGLLVKVGRPAMEAALLLAPLVAASARWCIGWFCVRLSGVYLAMLTLAFAQITWAMCFQWDAVTGGSNGLVGVWPRRGWPAKTAYYYWLTLALVAAGVLRAAAGAVLALWLRAARGRDSPCAPMPSASTCAACSGRLCGGGRFCGLAGRCMCSPRAAFRPRAFGGQVGGWPGDGAAGRRADAGGPCGGRGHLYLAARHRGPQHRLLARRAGRHHAGAGAAVSAGLRGFARLLALRWQARRSAP
jgi:branched-chain amino acid transport system permease protein